MKVLIKKEIYEKFMKRLDEKSSRGDKLFRKAKPNFFGNFGSVKSFNYFDEDEDELPLKTSNTIKPQMTTQLSVDAPPVDDPDYIPASVYELGLAAKLIAEEVPPQEIEYFYRKLHLLLDKAIDRRHEKKMVNEALDIENLEPMIKLRLQKMLPRYENAVKSGEATPEKVADTLLPKLRTNKITREELIAHLSEFSPAGQPAAKQPSAPVDPFVSPPDSLSDMSPTKKKRKVASTKLKDPVSGIKYDPTVSLDDLEGPTYQEMKDLDRNIIKQLVKIDEDKVEENEFIESWEFDETEAPLTKVIFAISMAIYDVSYEVRRMKIIAEKGGQRITKPETRFDTGIRAYPEEHPLSRPYAKRFLAQAKQIYGITPENSFHQENVIKMSKEQLEDVLIKSVNAVINRIPEIKQKINNIINTHPLHKGETLESTINLIIEAIASKMMPEARILDRDIVGMSVEAAFKRCLVDLPDPIKIPKAYSGYGGNMPAFKKRVKMFPDEFKKQLPDAILKTLLTLKSRGKTVSKIAVSGNTYTFVDRKTKIDVKIEKKDLEGVIKNFVNDIVDKNVTGSIKTSGKEEDPLKQSMQIIKAIDTEKEEEKEKLDKDGLNKDEAELKAILLDLKKMVEGDSWMHMAPLFGFSGASGIRQWFLKFPESKHKLSVAARKGVPAAAKALQEIHFFYDTIAKFFVDNSNLENQEGKSGAARILADEMSKKKNLSDDDKAEIKLVYQISNDLRLMSDMLSGQDVFDLEDLPEYNEIKYRPGGAVLQFLVGKVFENVLKKNFNDWYANAVKLLTSAGVDAGKAKPLAHYLTGGNKVPDFTKLKKAAKKFIDAGVTKEKFYSLYEQSYLWFFDNMSKGLTQDDTLAKEIRYFEDNTLYNDKGKINKPVYNKLKKMLQDAIKEYQKDLGVQIATNRIKQMLAKAAEEFPQLKLTGEEQSEETKEKDLQEFRKILKSLV
mgnify:CR=1 FL=1